MTIATGEEACELVRTRGLLMLVDEGSLPSLCSAVAGEPVRGSWWGHPQGKLIFELANAIEDSGEVLTVKLIAGKVTFVHKALWPALYRVVTDMAFRNSAYERLSDATKKLATRADRDGRLSFADVAAEKSTLAKAKAELEKSLLLLVSSEHTASGKHATVLESWSHWAAGREAVLAAAERLTFESALAELRVAAKGVRLAFDR